MQTTSNMSPYLATVRASHDLAELLKRLRPDLLEQVEALQYIVKSSQTHLDALTQRSQDAVFQSKNSGRDSIISGSQSSEMAAVTDDLDAAYQALQDLKHADK